MRALASRNVVREEVDERFSLTELGAPLAGNAPDSLRREALWRASEGYLRTWGSLAQTVRSGEPGFEHVFGEPFFDYLGHNAQLAEVFNDVMTESSENDDADAIVDSHDFGRYHQVVDVGGGRGALLGSILNRHAHVSGVLYDISDVIGTTEDSFNGFVRAGRANKIAGNFFESVPSGGDAYVLKFIVHDWDDAAATKILKNCREAMNDGASVLLVEVIRPPDRLSPEVSFLDLTMMLFLHGRERTEAEYSRLLSNAGLRLLKTTATASGYSILQARAS